MMQGLKHIAQALRIEAHTAWLCARDPDLAWPVRLFGLAIAAYALSPIDLIPDFIPVLGLLDDALLVPAALWLFLRMVPAPIYARHKETARVASTRPVSRAGAAIILLIWTAALLGTALLLHHHFGR